MNVFQFWPDTLTAVKKPSVESPGQREEPSGYGCKSRPAVAPQRQRGGSPRAHGSQPWGRPGEIPGPTVRVRMGEGCDGVRGALGVRRPGLRACARGPQDRRVPGDASDGRRRAHGAELCAVGRARTPAPRPPNPWVGCVIVARRRDRRAPGSTSASRRAARRGRRARRRRRAAPGRHRVRDARAVLAPRPHPAVRRRAHRRRRRSGRRRARGSRPAGRAAAGSERLRAARRRRRRRSRAPTAATRSLAPYLHHRRTRPRVLPRQDRLEPRRARRRRRRHLAVDHRRRGPRRRAPAARRVAGGRRRRRAPRSPTDPRSPSATSDRRPSSRASRCASLLDARGRVPADGPLFDASTGSAPTLVVTTDRRRPAAVDAWRRRRGEGRDPSPPGARDGVDLDGHARAPRPRRTCSRPWSRAARRSTARSSTTGLVDRVVAYVARTVLGPGTRLAGCSRSRRPTRSPTRRACELASTARIARRRRPPRLRGHDRRTGAADVHRHRRGAGPGARRSPERGRRRGSRSTRTTVLDDARSALRSRSTAAA